MRLRDERFAGVCAAFCLLTGPVDVASGQNHVDDLRKAVSLARQVSPRPCDRRDREGRGPGREPYRLRVISTVRTDGLTRCFPVNPPSSDADSRDSARCADRPA